jgi:hypothetical protein
MEHEITNAFKILVGKPGGKRHLRRPRTRWDDNFKISLKEIRVLGCALD